MIYQWITGFKVDEKTGQHTFCTPRPYRIVGIEDLREAVVIENISTERSNRISNEKERQFYLANTIDSKTECSYYYKDFFSIFGELKFETSKSNEKKEKVVYLMHERFKEYLNINLNKFELDFSPVEEFYKKNGGVNYLNILECRSYFGNYLPIICTVGGKYWSETSIIENENTEMDSKKKGGGIKIVANNCGNTCGTGIGISNISNQYAANLEINAKECHNAIGGNPTLADSYEKWCNSLQWNNWVLVKAITVENIEKKLSYDLNSKIRAEVKKIEEAIPQHAINNLPKFVQDVDPRGYDYIFFIEWDKKCDNMVICVNPAELDKFCIWKKKGKNEPNMEEKLKKALVINQKNGTKKECICSHRVGTLKYFEKPKEEECTPTEEKILKFFGEHLRDDCNCKNGKCSQQFAALIREGFYSKVFGKDLSEKMGLIQKK